MHVLPFSTTSVIPLGRPCSTSATPATSPSNRGPFSQVPGPRFLDPAPPSPPSPPDPVASSPVPSRVSSPVPVLSVPTSLVCSLFPTIPSVLMLFPARLPTVSFRVPLVSPSIPSVSVTGLLLLFSTFFSALFPIDISSFCPVLPLVSIVASPAAPLAWSPAVLPSAPAVLPSSPAVCPLTSPVLLPSAPAASPAVFPSSHAASSVVLPSVPADHTLSSPGTDRS